MLRSRFRTLTVFLSLAAAGVPLYADDATSSNSEPPAPKRHSTKDKLVRKDYAVAEWIDATNEANGADILMKAIVHLKPKSWMGDGGSATIQYDAEKKIISIRQTAEMHRRIGSLLEALTAIRHETHTSSSFDLLSSARPTVKSTPSAQAKQYGHIVLDDVRVNAMGVHCAIKRIRLQYKGDGINADVIGNTLANGEADSGKNLEKEEKVPAEMKRLFAEDKKEVKVVLWAYMPQDQGEELTRADSRLAGKLAEEIRRLSEENKEKVTIIEPDRVERYKSRHPNWQALELTTVAHDFNADYVIALGIDKLSLYEPKANQQIYQGQTEILVSVVDMKSPDDVLQKEFFDRYPTEARGDMTPLDITPYQFRDKFLKHVAKQLAFYFVDHKKSARMVQIDE